MGEIFTGYSVPKTLKRNENQVVSNLRKEAIQQNVRSANDGFQQSQSIFNQNQDAFSSTENNFLAKAFEQAATEKACQRMEDNLGLLRFKEKAINNTQDISTNKFIKHEEMVQQNPEVVGVEKEIQENKTKIQATMKALVEQNQTNAVYQNALKLSTALTKEISQLQNVEFTLVNDISSIKAQINDIKSGKISLADLQINVTGSTSTTAVDTSSLIKTNSTSIAIIGGNQISGNKGLQTLLEDLKSNTQVDQKQEELENAIKKSIIESLETLLGKKEEDLSKTKQQIQNKESQFDANQNKISSYEVENKDKTTEKTSLEQQLESLIQKSLDLVQERLRLDPQVMKFSSMSNFFNNVIKGNGKNGSGLNPDVSRTKESLSELKDVFENKTSQTDNTREMYEIKSFLRNEAKSSLDNSRMKTEVEKNLFANIKATSIS